jgi:IS4 transposase
MAVNKPSDAQVIADMIKDLESYLTAGITSIDDPTRVYEYGVVVHTGLTLTRKPSINDMRSWCNDTLGPKPYGEYYGDRWMISNNTFWFKNERDRTLFLIKWST